MLKLEIQNAEAAIDGCSEKRYYRYLKKRAKNQKLKNEQSHWRTLRYILLKRSSSISISQEYLPRPQEDLFSRTALGGHFQILRYKKKIDLRDYFNKTSLFVKNFKINH